MMQDSDRSSLRWQAWVIPMAAGFVFSSLVVLLAVPAPAHVLTWRGLFSRSAGLMLLAAASALAMMWAVCRTFREQLGLFTRSLRAYAWSTAIWLPLLFILWSEHAAWVILAPLPITAILAHFTRRQILATDAPDDSADDDFPAVEDYVSPGSPKGTILTLRFNKEPVALNRRPNGRALFAIASAPWPRTVGLPAVILALLLQATSFSLAAGMPALAESFLIVLTAAMVWFFTTVPPAVLEETTRSGNRKRRAAVVPCFLLTCLALTPLLQAGLHAGVFSNAVMAGSRAMTPPQIKPDVEHAYAGIILLAPPLPKRERLAPTPASLNTGGSLHPTRPLIIPFDGSYRYFEKWPLRDAREVRTQRGDPITANVHSADNAPLSMTAHQQLGQRIRADCCRGIDLALTNGDNRYGRIDVEMVLNDVHAGKATASRSLGTFPIRSSLQEKISLYRAPVNEVLHFPIPGDAKALQFNDITLRIKLSEHRDMAGAKVRVKDFKLIP